MLILFLISLAVLFYIFIGYPIVLAVLSSLLAKTVRREEITPEVSLIISAYNEQDVIREKLENTLALDYPKEKLEVIVASEAADGTNDIVRQYAGRGVILHAYENREGKSATLWRTVPLARAARSSSSPTPTPCITATRSASSCATSPIPAWAA